MQFLTSDFVVMSHISENPTVTSTKHSSLLAFSSRFNASPIALLSAVVLHLMVYSEQCCYHSIQNPCQVWPRLSKSERLLSYLDLRWQWCL